MRKTLLPIIIGLIILTLLLAGCKPRASPLTNNPGETAPETTPTPSSEETPTPTSITPPKPKDQGLDVAPSQMITATISDVKITLDKSTVKAGRVKFIVTNDGPRFPHALRVADKSTGKPVGDQVGVNVDEVDTLVVELTAGTYDVYSPLGKDRQKGITTTLTVTA